MRKAVAVAIAGATGVGIVLVRRRTASWTIEPERPEQVDEPAAEAPVARSRRFSRTKDELYEEARRVDLPGRSRMTKQELADALAEFQPTSVA